MEASRIPSRWTGFWVRLAVRFYCDWYRIRNPNACKRPLRRAALRFWPKIRRRH